MSQSFGNISHIHCFRVHILVCIHQAHFNNVGEGARQVSCSKNSKLGGGGGGGIAVSSSEFILFPPFTESGGWDIHVLIFVPRFYWKGGY